MKKLKHLIVKKIQKKVVAVDQLKCITHNLWDDLEKHINSFFESKNLNELDSKQENIF